MEGLESGAKQFADLVVDTAAREVTYSGQVVHLTRTEYNLLLALADRAGRALTRQEIVALVWGDAWFGDTHFVTVHVSNLRRKIGDGEREPPLIRTLHGVGYRFDDPHRRPPPAAATGCATCGRRPSSARTRAR